MGYLLPIQLFQYNDYQTRTIGTKQNPQFIDKPFKVILEKQHQEIINKYDRINKTLYQNTISKQTNEKIIAALTGKGRHFSESV